VDFKRLQTAVDWSVRQLEQPRKQRVDMVRQFVGSHYFKNPADMRVPTNMLELAVTIYVSRLAARSPRVMVSAIDDSMRPFAKNMELALNQIPEEIGLHKVLRRVVLEAIFGIGVVKVGICSGQRSYMGHDVGESFVDVVTLDDYFLDMSAKSRSGIQFEGNDYWLSIDDARAMYEDGSPSEIEPDKHTVTGDQGEARAEGISVDEGADLYSEKVWMRDVWLPGSNQMVTYGVKSRKLFRVVPWDGPEHGPYFTLGFSDVPGNLLPLPPASLWIDLHELANSVFRKLARQADARKTIAAFPGGNDESVEALRKASDGEGIRYSGAKPEMISVGGIDQASLAFFLQTRDMFSYFAGNLDALGGLSPQSETAKQDQLISDAANARLDYWISENTYFVESVFKSLAWYEWTDPMRTRTIQKPVEGSDIVLRREWSKETREGDFLDYNIKLDAYSLQADTPALKLQKIGMALERFVFPAMEMIQQQGGSIDFKKLLELVGKLGNVEEIKEIVVFGGPQQQSRPMGGSPQPSFKPSHTTRTYERVNRPGATRSGKDDVMSRLLLGGNVQSSEAATVGRPIS